MHLMLSYVTIPSLPPGSPCGEKVENILTVLDIVSAFLAGMKRSTGLTPSLKKDVTENKEINGWIEKYLGVGEWVMDTSVAFAGSSGFFERKR
ncbi:uncharacterized protein Bfra_000149 [Botrytis fragariae]|uniref:Uncharacterized protein n=1 Tax=Botrytis fragariae TaxID=1964551 RepID=A0A8H6B2H2_9HELO|nr:uncharacterized protein Bfra_000149 [Botrytis fragariae]KAF5877984.1 hypothetical protein Bfra_000149 [Botrytis fragariae]